LLIYLLIAIEFPLGGSSGTTAETASKTQSIQVHTLPKHPHITKPTHINKNTQTQVKTTTVQDTNQTK
jgi:hypothetical protein